MANKRKENTVVAGSIHTRQSFYMPDGKVTATASELNALDGITTSVAELNTLDGQAVSATITIGAEAGNAINVGIQLKDANGANVASAYALDVYISDDSGGDGLAAVGPSAGVAIGTNGTILSQLVTSKLLKILTTATGDFDVDLSEVATPTFYLVVVLPSGQVTVSGAITFA